MQQSPPKAVAQAHVLLAAQSACLGVPPSPGEGFWLQVVAVWLAVPQAQPLSQAAWLQLCASAPGAKQLQFSWDAQATAAGKRCPPLKQQPMLDLLSASAEIAFGLADCFAACAPQHSAFWLARTCLDQSSETLERPPSRLARCQATKQDQLDPLHSPRDSCQMLNRLVPYTARNPPQRRGGWAETGQARHSALARLRSCC